METFTASNGIDVAWRDSDSGLRVLHTNAERCIAHVVPYPGWQVVGEANQNSSGSGFTETSETAKALREFFLAERDQELGRWRDPENLHRVAYPTSPQTVFIMDESTGQGAEYSRQTATDSSANYGDRLKRQSARAYFAAHPVPKPWHDAKPGEVWVLEMDGEERAFMLDSSDHFDHYGSYYEKDDPRITEGRRIWPEVE